MNIITTTEQFKHIQSWEADWLPEGYAVIPDGFDTTEFYQYNGCVDLTVQDNTITAITPNLTAWSPWKATQPTQEETLATDARVARDKLLTACDWTQMSDCPLSDTVKASWLVYRQSLRDVPEQEGFPTEVVWPVSPE